MYVCIYVYMNALRARCNATASQLVGLMNMGMGRDGGRWNFDVCQIRQVDYISNKTDRFGCSKLTSTLFDNSTISYSNPFYVFISKRLVKSVPLHLMLRVANLCKLYGAVVINRTNHRCPAIKKKKLIYIQIWYIIENLLFQTPAKVQPLYLRLGQRVLQFQRFLRILILQAILRFYKTLMLLEFSYCYFFQNFHYVFEIMFLWF